MNAKKLFAALILVAIFAAFVQPILSSKAQASGTYPEGYIYVTTTANLNLRSGPNSNTGTPILDVVPQGTRLLAMGRNNTSTWVLVEYNGLRGWLAAWLLKIEGDIATLPPMEGETGDSGDNGSQHCKLDKIVNSGNESITTEIGGSHWQHFAIWDPGVKEVSFLIKPSVPSERPIVYATGRISAWEDTLGTCGDMLKDALAYVQDRPANHMGLIFEVDVVKRTARVVYNAPGWTRDQQIALLQRFFGTQLSFTYTP